MTKGYFAFVLHGHLPYVLSHGRWPHGTDWLTEAAAETYLPVIRALDELVAEGYQPKLTMGVSPVLSEQLADDSFREEFGIYLDQKIKAAQYDSEEFYRYGQDNMLKNSRYWEEFYNDTRAYFDSIDQDIIGSFKRLQDSGYLELITCGATHGYYPLLSRDESLQVQTKMAVKCHTRHFGKAPRGIWLPECAYRPRYSWKPPVPTPEGSQERLRKGADEFLSENGLDFFIVDSALLKGGKAVGVYIDRFEALKLLWDKHEKEYQPREEEVDKTPREVYLIASAPEGKKPTAIFTRDPETGLLVWSGEHGYPGDGHYLDFHKKRFPGGHRYWAVTSSQADLGDKVEYHHESAAERIVENSEHFAGKIGEILSDYQKESDRPGILVAPYDAELFGHWWFEGPRFLKQVLKHICDSPDIELTHLSEDLDRRKASQIVSIPEGSWGEGNHHYIWLNEQTEWTWKHIYKSESKMCELARFRKANPDRMTDQLEDVMKQAARELMLMSSSDWQFLISTFAARDYGELRLGEHFADFERLANLADRLIGREAASEGDGQFLADCQQRDNLFQDIDLDWFAAVEFPAK